MLKKVVAVAAATSGLVLAGAGVAAADADAKGLVLGSSGLISGNSVQAPVDVEANACGNTVDVVGALNSTFGNRCVID